MKLDFALLLTVLSAFTGIVWLVDALFFAKARKLMVKEGEEVPEPVLVDYSRSLFPVLFFVLMLRSFVAEPFRIPSESMMPNLLVGDFILVNKFAYGLRDPVFHNKLLQLGAPERGDVVVFRYPVDPSKDFIKRVIGLPGDRVAYRNKQLWVNGEAMPLEAAGVYTSGGTAPGVVYRFEEALGATEHHVIVNPSRPAEDFEFQVPEGQYFMMGDNRDGSDDSRRWGTVPEGHLVGRAFLVWMSWDGSRFRPDWSRIGNRID